MTVKTRKLPLPVRHDKWKSFMSWCKHHGDGFIDTAKLEIRAANVEGTEFGLFSRAKSVEQNDVLLRIPRKLFLSNETASCDEQLGSNCYYYF